MTGITEKIKFRVPVGFEADAKKLFLYRTPGDKAVLGCASLQAHRS